MSVSRSLSCVLSHTLVPCCHKFLRPHSSIRQLGTAVTLTHPHPYPTLELTTRPRRSSTAMLTAVRIQPSCLLPFYPSTLLPFYPSTLLPFYPSTLLPFYPFTILTLFPSTLLPFYTMLSDILNLTARAFERLSSFNPHTVASEYLPLFPCFYHATSCRLMPPWGPPPTTPNRVLDTHQRNIIISLNRA